MKRVSVLFYYYYLVEKIFSFGYISSNKISPILLFEGLKRFVLVKILQETKIAHSGVKQLLIIVYLLFGQSDGSNWAIVVAHRLTDIRMFIKLFS